MDLRNPTGHRRHAQCPRCGALERHRLQALVIEQVLAGLDCQRLGLLHFAPEPFFSARFRSLFGRYETADLYKKKVDHRVDIQALPFADQSYDVVYASHVLEHIPDDRKALAELRRILRPGGLAILPVPLVCEHTIEYDQPNPQESFHVRAPGEDYYDRYRDYFAEVKLFPSTAFPARHQTFILSDRLVIAGSRLSPRKDPHIDVVPVCYV